MSFYDVERVLFSMFCLKVDVLTGMLKKLHGRIVKQKYIISSFSFVFVSCSENRTFYIKEKKTQIIMKRIHLINTLPQHSIKLNMMNGESFNILDYIHVDMRTKGLSF